MYAWAAMTTISLESSICHSVLQYDITFTFNTYTI